MKIFAVFVLIILMTVCGFSQKKMVIQTKSLLEVGKGRLMFQNIGSVCEDDQGNFYVLDRKAHKVKKFSADGTKLLGFGRKGQGPGDVTRPHRLSLSTDGRVVVTERIDVVSFFDAKGTFVDKTNFASTVGFVFYCDNAGRDLFYAEKRLMDGSFKQVLFNGAGEVVNEALFNIPPPGVQVGSRTYLAIDETYSPFLLFSHYKNHSVAAVSNKYEIVVLDLNGKAVRRIKRKIAPDKISGAEKKQFVTDLKETPFPPGVGKEIIRKLPKTKNYFRKLLVTGTHVFAFRIKTNTLDKKASVPVDVFTIKGKFLGTASIKKIPVYMSAGFIYTAARNNGDDLVLVKQSYSLK